MGPFLKFQVRHDAPYGACWKPRRYAATRGRDPRAGTMDEVPIFESGSVVITPSVARFGEMSYQIGNIGSIMLHEVRSLGPLAIALLIFGVLGVLFGLLQR